MKAIFPLGLPLLESDKSITSSCNNDAVCIISTISANRRCLGNISSCPCELSLSPGLLCPLIIGNLSIGLDKGSNITLGFIPCKIANGDNESSIDFPAMVLFCFVGVPLKLFCSVTSIVSIGILFLSSRGIFSNALDKIKTINGRTFFPSASK